MNSLEGATATNSAAPKGPTATRVVSPDFLSAGGSSPGDRRSLWAIVAIVAMGVTGVTEATGSIGSLERATGIPSAAPVDCKGLYLLPEDFS